MYSVYILYSVSADKYYIGHTEDIDKRLYQHNNPIRHSKYTSKHLPWTLVVYFPKYATRAEAMKVEKFIKKQKSKKFIKDIISQKVQV